MNRKNAVDVTAVTTTGLMAGLFLAYSVSIIPAFRRLPDQAYLQAFQEINRAILNPVFFVVFFGAPLSLAIATVQRLDERRSQAFKLLLAATVLYAIGSFGITVSANVPLNDRLEAFAADTASPEQLAQFRSDFEGPWNGWHTTRTIASVAAFGLVAASRLRKDEES